MDNSEPVDFGLAWILFKHGVNNALPSVIGVAKVQGIVQQGHMAFNDAISQCPECFKLVPLIFWINAMLGYVSFGMAQVNLGQG